MIPVSPIEEQITDVPVLQIQEQVVEKQGTRWPAFTSCSCRTEGRSEWANFMRKVY